MLEIELKIIEAKSDIVFDMNSKELELDKWVKEFKTCRVLFRKNRIKLDSYDSQKIVGSMPQFSN